MGLLRTLAFGPEPEQIEKRSGDFVTDLGVAFAAYLESVDVNATADNSVPAVFRAHQIYSDVVASLPMDSVNEATGQVGARPDILRNPNPDESYHDTMASVVSSLFWTGNAYLIPTTYDRSGMNQSLIVAKPSEVQVEWDKPQIFREYAWRDKPMKHGQDIIHIAMNRGPGDLTGVGPIAAARLLMMGIKAEHTFARTLFTDNATPGGALKVPENISQSEAKVILDLWEDTHKGRLRPAILGGGTDWVQMTMNPVDAQFIEKMQFSVQEIARLTGLPGHFLLVESGDSLTYSTTESLFRLWLTASLNPTYLERIAAAFSRLLPHGEIARFDTTELLRADQKARFEAHQVGITAGFITPNEAREAEGLKGLEGGDELKTPQEMPTTSV